MSVIHGIYVKSTPKSKWHLVSLAISPEAANFDVEQCRKQNELAGRNGAQVAVQLFESAFHIPEYLDEVKDTKPLYN